MLKLKTPVTDLATGMKGMLTHFCVMMGGSCFYNFQPLGLNKETGEPLEKFWITEPRVKGGVPADERRLPWEVLGTIAEDEASGFKGMAIEFTLYTNGCVHVALQPSSLIPKTGEKVKAVEFDIRRLKGKAIKPMTEAEKEADEFKRPSPSETRSPLTR